jgi:hypothetical protein
MHDDERTTACFDEFYCCARAKGTKEPVVVRFWATASGWESRGVWGSTGPHNNRYVSHEDFNDVLKWIQVDFGRSYSIVHTRGEADAWYARKTADDVTGYAEEGRPDTAPADARDGVEVG